LFEIWFVVAALVLLLAAASKVIWIITDPLWEDIAVGGAWLTIPAIVAECWVAGYLLFGPRRVIAAGLGMAIHAIFLCFGIGLWMTGTNCQCFGDLSAMGLEIPAWMLPIYNLVAIFLFAFAFRQAAGVAMDSHSGGISSARWWPQPGEQVGIILGLTLFLFVSSTVQGQQLWRPGMGANEVVLQIPELGPLSPGSEYETEITIHNRLSQPIRIVGGGASCTCLTLDSIPLEVPGNGKRAVTVRFKVGKHLAGQQEFRNSLVYFLEGGRQFQVRGVVRGTIDNSR